MREMKRERERERERENYWAKNYKFKLIGKIIPLCP